MTDSLSAAQARRVSLASQGFTGRRPVSSPSRAGIEKVVRGLRVLQLDSVNVFERSHYLPVFSRCGPYDRTRLDSLTGDPPVLTECWAHEAALVPVEDHPLFEFRRARMRARYGDREIYRDNPRLRAWLLAQIAERGPLRASDIDHEHNRRTGAWWGLSRVKRLLEYQFLFGELATAGRAGFERRYALPEQVLPGHLIGAGAPEGWNSRGGAPVAAWLHRDALLTPFDPVVWYRPRAERIHGFCRDELRGWLEEARCRDVCFHDAGVVGKEVDGERQDFPMFLAVAKV